MATWSVELIRIGAVAPALLRRLREDLALCLSHPVIISARQIDHEPFFARRRGQYDANGMLEQMLISGTRPSVHYLGVTDVDLFLPVFAHVLGAAQLNGPVAVTSVYRLRPEFVGELPDPQLLRLRVLKEALHELGHTFGLVHCQASWCAMSPSNLPEKVDLKDPAFCRSCGEKMGVPDDGINKILLKGDLP